jgi:uncharacterized protein (TIGR03067 family)
MKLVLKGETYLVDVGGQPDEGKCKRDPAKSPKTLDITSAKGANEGKTFLAIYELKVDELKVCYDLSETLPGVGSQTDRRGARRCQRPASA